MKWKTYEHKMMHFVRVAHTAGAYKGTRLGEVYRQLHGSAKAVIDMYGSYDAAWQAIEVFRKAYGIK